MAANSQEYIAHHLTNLTYGKLPAGYVRTNADGSETELTESTWTLAKSGKKLRTWALWRSTSILSAGQS